MNRMGHVRNRAEFVAEMTAICGLLRFSEALAALIVHQNWSDFLLIPGGNLWMSSSMHLKALENVLHVASK